MEISIPVNHNYYEESPINEENLKNSFKLSKQKQLKKLKEEVFSSVYKLSTKNSNLSQLQIFGFKNQKSKLEEEERLILKLYAKEQDNIKEYIIQTGLYAGVVYHKGYKFNITTKYGDIFLKRMLNFVNDIYIDNQISPASKKQETNEFQFIIAYLFIQSLEKAAVLGLPHDYQTKKQRSNKVRGKIDLNAYLKTDIPFQGKLTTIFKEQMYVQEIVDVLYLALKKLEVKFGKDINKNLLSLNQLLKQKYSGRFTSNETIDKAKNHSILYNPMYTSFKKVLEYAEIILSDNDLSPSEKKDNFETTGYLFDISQLFEVYLEKLLSTHFKDWYVSSQTELKLYSNLFFSRKMLPDLIMKHKKSNKIIVFDAKFKTMRLETKPSSISDLDRSDFYQIHTYIQYFQPNVILGGLIYPLSQQLNKGKAHANGLFGKLEKQDTKFIVDGVYVTKGMSAMDLVENEKEFLSRIRSTIDSSEIDNNILSKKRVYEPEAF